MKYNIKSGIKLLILTSICFFTNIPANADIVLNTSNVFDVTASSYIENKDNKIYLTKDSELVIKINQTIGDVSSSTIEFEEYESIDLNILNEKKEVVFSLNNKDPENPLSNFHKYSTILDNRYVIKVPITFSPGKYTIILNVVDIYSKTETLNQDFFVSGTAYSLEDINVIVEEKTLYGNVKYLSFDENIVKDEENKVKITLLNGDKEVFSKEMNHVFSGSGFININENLTNKIDFKKPLTFNVDVENTNGEVLLSKSTIIQGTAVSYKNTIIIILSIVLVMILFIIFFFKKRTKIPALIVVSLLSFGLTVTINANTITPEYVNANCQQFGSTSASCVYLTNYLNNLNLTNCGSKPQDTCVAGKILTSVCKTDSSCDTSVVENTRVMKYFSTGIVVNQKGTSSAGVNVCTSLGNLSSGESFYVLSDKSRSSWIKERYSVYEFKKGTSATFTNIPYSKKTNVETMSYDGNCNVQLTSRYSGKDSKFKQTNAHILEVGKVSIPSMCKSRKVNSDEFYTNNNNNLVSLNNCQNNELFDTFISYGELVDLKSATVWVGPVSVSVNMCTTLGNMATGESFYVLSDKVNSSWIGQRYSVYEFKKGTSATFTNMPYRKKTNVETMTYDGNCNVRLTSQYSGKSSNYKMAQANIVELGKFSNATCKSLVLKDNIFSKTGGEYETLPYCASVSTSVSECKNNYKWAPSQTDVSCDLDDDEGVSCVCNNRNRVCTEDGVVSTTTNSVACALSSYCSTSSSGTNSVFTIYPTNSIGNVVYTNQGTTVTKNKNEPYEYTLPKVEGVQSITVLLRDTFDNQNSSSVCSIDNTISLPPEVKILKSPSTSINQGGNCTIEWDLKNIPSDVKCTLQGNNESTDVTGYGSKTFGPLNQNTLFTLSCSGPNFSVAPVSTICRINPKILEI
jgi:hypothetical protein